MRDHHHHHLPHLIEHFKLEVSKLAIEAHEKGPGWGVFLGDPGGMRAETPEEEAELEIARARGVYLGLAPVDELVRELLRDAEGEPIRESAAARLLLPPPPAHVHVLGVLGGELVTFDAPVMPAEWVEQEDRERARIGRIEELLRLAAPIARQRAAEGMPPGSIFIAEPEGDGVRVALRTAAEALEILPLEEVHGGARAARKLLEPAPAGKMKLAVAFGGGFSVATLPIAAEAAEAAE